MYVMKVRVHVMHFCVCNLMQVCNYVCISVLVHVHVCMHAYNANMCLSNATHDTTDCRNACVRFLYVCMYLYACMFFVACMHAFKVIMYVCDVFICNPLQVCIYEMYVRFCV